MAECNTCGGYLSMEDKIRLSMKCDANGNVVWQGALLNQAGYSDAVIAAMIADGYVPIASPADLNAIRAVQTDRVFAAGTKWETTVTTTGLAGNYIQVADIDLYDACRTGGVYDNSGTGWNPIGGIFSGIYDGGGQIIHGLYINKPTISGNGLFYTATSDEFRNIIFSHPYVVGKTMNGVLLGAQSVGASTKLSNIAINGGYVYCKEQHSGGIVGRINGIVLIHNCQSTCVLIADLYSIGLFSGASLTTTIVANSWGAGILKNLGGFGLHNRLLTGRDICTVINCYADISISSYVNAEGTLLTTEQFLSIKEADTIISESTQWQLQDYTRQQAVSYNSKVYVCIKNTTESQLPTDADYWLDVTSWSKWRFIEGLYPVNKMLGKLGMSYPPPNVSITSENGLVISWVEPNIKPLGYNVYLYENGHPVKLNANLLSTLSYTYAPTTADEYEFFVKAVYDIRGIQMETANSEIVSGSYYQTELLKVDETNVILTELTEPDNTDMQLTVSTAKAKEFGGIEYEIPMISCVVDEGAATGTWLGEGTLVTRTFDDAKRTIVQVISIAEGKLSISSEVTYKQNVKIDYEGFTLSGFNSYSKFENIFATGSGQSIMNYEGIFFHHGQFTQHPIHHSGYDEQWWKEYNIGDKETTKLYFLSKSFRPARILHQPNGYNAAITIGNHADGANEARTRALFYGVDDPNHPDFGKKGIIARGVKCDWSVFARHFWGYEHADDNPGFSEFPTYLQLLKDIHAEGQEIIPHTTWVNTDKRTDASTYLPMYQEHFGSKNYIDHGFADVHSAAITSKGWDSNDAENYMMDLFEQNGFTMAWNYLTHPTLSSVTPKRRAEWQGRIKYWGFEHFVAYHNDHLKLPASGNHVLLWLDGQMDLYNRAISERLEWALDNCESFNIHGYWGGPSRVNSVNSDSTDIRYLLYFDDNEGKYKITTAFDNFLKTIQAKREAGELWNPTTTDFLLYFDKIRKVQLDIVNSTTYKLTNPGSAIDGFSMLVCKTGIAPTSGGVAVNTKNAKKGTICWFNLPTGETTITWE